MDDVDAESGGADPCDQGIRLDLVRHVLESDKDEQRNQQVVRSVMLVEELIELARRQADVQVISTPKRRKIADGREYTQWHQVFFRNRVEHEIGAEQEIADIRLEQSGIQGNFEAEELRQKRQEAGKDDPEHQKSLEGFLVHVSYQQLQKRRHDVEAGDGVEKPQVVIDVISQELHKDFISGIGLAQLVNIVQRVDEAPENQRNDDFRQPLLQKLPDAFLFITRQQQGTAEHEENRHTPAQTGIENIGEMPDPVVRGGAVDDF